MFRWPWTPKPPADRDELAEARAHLARGRQAIDGVRAQSNAARHRLDHSLAREEQEVRENHLGALMHDALVVRRRPS